MFYLEIVFEFDFDFKLIIDKSLLLILKFFYSHLLEKAFKAETDLYDL